MASNREQDKPWHNGPVERKGHQQKEVANRKRNESWNPQDQVGREVAAMKWPGGAWSHHHMIST